MVDCQIITFPQIENNDMPANIHDGSFRYDELGPEKYRVAFSAKRDKRATAQSRRYMKKQKDVK